MIYPNNDVYDGKWLDDKRHGNGKMIFADGNVKKCEWKRDY